MKASECCTVDQTNWKYRHLITYGTVIVKMLVWIITRWSCVCHWYWFEEYIIVIITSIVNTWTLAFFQNLSPCFCWWTLVWCECVHFLMCLGTLSVHYALITDNVWFFFIRTCHHIGSPLQISQGLTFFKSLVDFRVCTVKTHLLKMNFVIFFKAKSIECTFKYW